MSIIPDSEPTWYWDKFKDLPKMQTHSALYPQWDGDTELLNELIDQIMDAYPAALQSIPPDWIYRQTKDALWIDPEAILRTWPSDRAGMLLRRWRHGQS